MAPSAVKDPRMFPLLVITNASPVKDVLLLKRFNIPALLHVAVYAPEPVINIPLPVVAAPISNLLKIPPEVIEDPPVMIIPRPLVIPVLEIDNVVPVKLAVLFVINAIVPAVEAVEDRSRRVPVVVEVSMDVEDNLNKDPPFAMTEVVWAIFSPAPVVSAESVSNANVPV